MARRLAAIMAMAWVLALVAPAGAAQAERPPAHVTPKVIIKPVATALHWLDTSLGEVEGGTWHKVTTVTYTYVGCTPGESLYWLPEEASQDGRPIYQVFEGLGQGETTCGRHGTSTYSSRWFGDPQSLHPGWMTFSVTLIGEPDGNVLGTATRRILIPSQHRSY